MPNTLTYYRKLGRKLRVVNTPPGLSFLDDAFHVNLIFHGKVGAYLGVALIICSTLSTQNIDFKGCTSLQAPLTKCSLLVHVFKQLLKKEVTIRGLCYKTFYGRNLRIFVIS